ncbi:PhoH-like protein [Caloramator mitchellensis]|uniref:PhoH-like protein n=1 Tax=Caloramator mitchellensis TaxID=908809 RepID=A0A0R3K4M7_CALMK|nr:AAA family ATPase [Caloramator mitchellensis]KRQ88069.1 PhoH-like protein [Caloramator mitchellensis]
MKTIKNEDIKSLQECYIIGYLATDEKLFPSIGEEQKAVTYLKKNPEYILFYVKPISTLPKKLFEIPGPFENNLFIGFEKALENIQMPPDFWHERDIKVKKNSIYDKLQNKLILFKPFMKKDDKSKNETYYRNLVVYDIEQSNISFEKRYVPLPSPGISSYEFEKSIIQQLPIELPLYNNEFENPEIIICDDYIYGNLNWITSRGKRILSSIGEIKKIKIDESFYEHIAYKVSDELMFIDEEYLESIKININERGSSIFQKEFIEIYKDAFKSEWQFLQSFKQYVLQEGLCYKDIDLYNFHVCVKTNPLTIISGMAGTGKTRLAVAYAKALGLDEEHYTVIPISPAYTEPADIIGYLNTSKEEFIPSETGIADILKRAMDKQDELFMIIFDEMNLSQVEYWFSPFISLLEMDEDERKLTLYNKNSNCKNSDKYPPNIMVKDNVIFVGTVNIDETTKDFSDRLLDRANVLTLQNVPFIEMKDMFKNRKKIEFNNFGQSKFLKAWRRDVEIPIDVYKENELKFFDKLHQIINSVDKQKGVSYRTLQHIALYILNIPENEKGEMLIDRGRAIDIAIKQRILTKIKGHQEQYGNLIGVCENNEVKDSLLYELFTDDIARKISDFKHSLEEIKRKAEEMYYNGYAS